MPCSSVRNALNYIEKNFSSDITLEAIADVCYVTKFHLAHKFKKATGKTIGEYIRFLRIEKAKKLLSETELSVSSVAYECGIMKQIIFTVFSAGKQASLQVNTEKNTVEKEEQYI